MIKKQKKLGLALGSGGWRGLAHIGAIKELLKHDIEISYIAGSSAGALVGGMYAAFQDIDKVETIFRENMHYRRLLYAFSDPKPRWGVFAGDKMEELFKKYLGNRRIEDLKIPFCALASDLLTGKAVELKKGSLSKAIHASSAVPFFLQPVRWDKMRLIDGATAVPIPAKTVKQMGAEVVIAINLQKNHFPINDHKISAFKTALKTSQVMLYNLAQYAQQPADLVLYPDIDEKGDYKNPFVGFVNRGDVFDDGEKVVRDNIQKIKELLV